MELSSGGEKISTQRKLTQEKSLDSKLDNFHTQNNMKYLGIDVGGGSIRGSLIDPSGTLYTETSIPTDKNWQNSEFIDSIYKLIDEIYKTAKPEAIGIGTPGPIDIESGCILKSANLNNILNVKLVSPLQQKYRVPVLFNNDANCAALGEYYFGNGKKCSNLITLTLGTGLGCGWVHNGKLYNGYKGNGMESGHMTIVMDGAKCGCGQNGCAESYFSATGLLNRYYDKTGKKLNSAKEIFTLVKNKDKEATEVLNFAIKVLAELIRNLAHSVNPQKIILVGGITESFDLFGEQLQQRVQEIIFPVFHDFLKIEVGSKIAGSYGAASLCFSY